MKKLKKTTMEILKENGVTLTPYQTTIIKKLDAIPNGKNARVVYKADKSSKLKAAFAHSYKVIKYSTFSIQKGVDYNNKKAVKEKRAQQIAQTGSYSTKPSWYEKFDNNIARSKSNINTLYLLASSNTNTNAKGNSYYEVTCLTGNGFKTTKMSSEELQKLGIMQPSFWSQSSSIVDFRTLKLEDVLDVYANVKK